MGGPPGFQRRGRQRLPVVAVPLGRLQVVAPSGVSQGSLVAQHLQRPERQPRRAVGPVLANGRHSRANAVPGGPQSRDRLTVNISGGWTHAVSVDSSFVSAVRASQSNKNGSTCQRTPWSVSATETSRPAGRASPRRPARFPRQLRPARPFPGPGPGRRRRRRVPRPRSTGPDTSRPHRSGATATLRRRTQCTPRAWECNQCGAILGVTRIGV